MKYSSPIFTGVIFASLLLISICNSSCDRLECRSVVCGNGGVCYYGGCKCPAPYYGSECQNGGWQSSSNLVNNTLTPAWAFIPGDTLYVYPGQWAPFVQWYSVAAIDSDSTITQMLYAYAYGATSTGPQIGLKVTWGFIDSFNQTIKTLNVDPSYFYLQIQNTDANDSTDSIYVNYGTPAQTVDYVVIPNNGVACSIGYYSVQPTTKIHITSNHPGTSWNFTPSIPDTANQSVLITIP